MGMSPLFWFGVCWIAFHFSVTPVFASAFHFRLIGEPETLDWNKAHTPVENYLMINLMEGLVILDHQLKPKPALSEKWTVSEDGRTYTFKLRKGVKWSDGGALKAADFVTSWKRLLSPSTGAAYAYFLFDIENAEAYYKGLIQDFSKVGVRAIDDATLKVTLTKPVAHWITLPSFWVTFPLRRDVLEKHGESWTKPGKMVTVGPYVLSAHQPDSKVVLKPNPHYYGGRGNITEVVGRVVREDSTALTLFESGQLHYMTDIPALDLERLKADPALRTFPYLKTGYFALVLGQAPSDNVHLRRAIAMALDKSKFAALLGGNQVAAGSFVPPGMLAHSRELGLPFDAVQAKTELKKSGIDPAKPVNLGIVIPNSERPAVLAQYIQSELKKNLGLTVTIQAFDNKTFRSKIDLKSYPSFILSWGADYPDPDNFLSMWLSDSGNNRTGWKSKAYDELILKARRMRKSGERERLYVQAQKLLLEHDAVIVPLYYDTNRVLISPKVKGLSVNPINYMYLKEARME